MPANPQQARGGYHTEIDTTRALSVVARESRALAGYMCYALDQQTQGGVPGQHRLADTQMHARPAQAQNEIIRREVRPHTLAVHPRQAGAE